MTGYVDRVRSLREGVTPGELIVDRYDHGGGRMYVLNDGKRTLVADTFKEGNREFFAEAPKAVTHLLARLDAIEALIGWLEAASADDEPLYCKGKVSARATAEQLRAALTGEGE